MGREIRMVPPNWEHPVVERPHGQGFQPMLNQLFEEAANEWKAEFTKWEAGERPSCFDPAENTPDIQFWEYNGGPPKREHYRPWKDSEATWFQVWETVSEGTPVTPPFATKQELIDYLVANGDFWDQDRRKRKAEGRLVAMNCDPWSREQAEAFVNGPGWAPSLVMQGGVIQSGVEALVDLDNSPQS